MLSQLAKKWRVRAAIILAVAYAFCVVSPSITLAFTQGSAAAHCFSDDHHRPPTWHKHHASYPHHDMDATGQSSNHDKGKPETCCGLFCVTAGAIPFSTSLADPVHATGMSVVLDDVLRGRPTDRIDRPPRHSLSFWSDARRRCTAARAVSKSDRWAIPMPPNLRWVTATRCAARCALLILILLAIEGCAATRTLTGPDPADLDIRVPSVAYRSALSDRRNAPPVGPSLWTAGDPSRSGKEKPWNVAWP